MHKWNNRAYPAQAGRSYDAAVVLVVTVLLACAAAGVLLGLVLAWAIRLTAG